MIKIYSRTCSECGEKIGVLGEQAVQIDQGELQLMCVDHSPYGRRTSDDEDLPLEG